MDIIYKTFAIYYTMCFMSLNLFFTWVHSPRDNSSAIYSNIALKIIKC